MEADVGAVVETVTEAPPPPPPANVMVLPERAIVRLELGSTARVTESSLLSLPESCIFSLCFLLFLNFYTRFRALKLTIDTGFFHLVSTRIDFS